MLVDGEADVVILKREALKDPPKKRGRVHPGDPSLRSG
jgi:hypothetical protein